MVQIQIRILVQSISFLDKFAHNKMVTTFSNNAFQNYNGILALMMLIDAIHILKKLGILKLEIIS